jgi:flagellar protein FlbD
VIKLTRLNNKAFVLNCELIKFIEETPDTVVTLTTNEKIVVREHSDVLIDRVIDYGRRLRVFRVE